MHAKVEIERGTLVLLARALRQEANGAELRRDLIRNLRAVATPAAQAVRTAILAMPVHSVHGAKEDYLPLRAAVAAGVRTRVRLSGKRAGVAILARKTPGVRGFRNAPKRLNAPFWRHPVFGDTDIWVTQVGAPGWFDATLKPFREPGKRAAAAAMAAIARRISAKTRG